MHVSVKFKLGASAVAANIFTKNGIELCGIIGGVRLVVVLFNRFVAATLVPRRNFSQLPPKLVPMPEDQSFDSRLDVRACSQVADRKH